MLLHRTLLVIWWWYSDDVKWWTTQMIYSLLICEVDMDLLVSWWVRRRQDEIVMRKEYWVHPYFTRVVKWAVLLLPWNRTREVIYLYHFTAQESCKFLACLVGGVSIINKQNTGWNLYLSKKGFYLMENYYFFCCKAPENNKNTLH